MGNCASGGDQAAYARSAAIDKQIEEDSKKFRKECKILLLGELFPLHSPLCLAVFGECSFFYGPSFSRALLLSHISVQDRCISLLLVIPYGHCFPCCYLQSSIGFNSGSGLPFPTRALHSWSPHGVVWGMIKSPLVTSALRDPDSVSGSSCVLSLGLCHDLIAIPQACTQYIPC
jgi:hypothetical protein